MKKLWAKLCTVLLAVVCLLSICACAPTLDIDKAADNLEDEDYVVVVADSDTEIETAVEMLGLPSSASIAVEEAMVATEDDNYLYMIKTEKSSIAKAYYNMIKHEYDAELQYLKDQIKLYEKFLKNYEDELSSVEINYIKDQIKEWKNELEDSEEIQIGRSGKWIWLGNKDAIKDSK